MTRKQLTEQIFFKSSCLCVGLDTDITKIPSHLLHESDPVFTFNKSIIDHTRDYCVSYKINTAFYEVLGAKGWEILEKTAAYIGKEHFIIADAKRGDIGNTSSEYARAFFETLPFDAVTVAPYMGSDSIKPFLDYEGKFAIVLGLTSNAGAEDFELQKCGGQFLYEKVISTVAGWGSTDNLMFVIGATQPGYFLKIREIIPEHFLLVPGVGAQGGNLKDILEKAMNKDCSLLINVSRDIIYASAGEDFAAAAGTKAKKYQQEMADYLQKIS